MHTMPGCLLSCRAFRLYLSSKFGKTAVLRLTHRYGGKTRCPKAAFHDCLVSVLSPPAQPNSNNGAAGAKFSAGSSHRSSSGSSSSSDRRPFLLYMEDDGQQYLLQLPSTWQQLPILQLRPLVHPRPGETAAAGELGSAAGPQTIQQPVLKPAFTAQVYQGPGGFPALATCMQPQVGPSPFPALDSFITRVCCGGGVHGEIRSWLVQAGSCCVVYNIKGNRWCGNVGRAHKSNGIFYCGERSYECLLQHVLSWLLMLVGFISTVRQ